MSLRKKHSLINYEFHLRSRVICLRISLSDFRTTVFVNNICVFVLYESNFNFLKFERHIYYLGLGFLIRAFGDRIKIVFNFVFVASHFP